MPKKKNAQIAIGIGGWVYEPWRGTFYPKGLPQKRELEYASGQLTSIEINGTFYGSQKPESFARWHDETPDDFVFALKGPRFATNRRVLAEASGSVEKFFQSGVTELKGKLGPINWQFAPTKKFDPDDFGAFLELLPRRLEGREIRHAVEVRHESFQCADFIALARAHSVAIVLAVDSVYPFIPDITAPFVYVRAMGTSENEPLGYGGSVLDAWAKRLKIWQSGREPEFPTRITSKQAPEIARDVYFYIISGHKVSNPSAAMALIERMT